MTTAQLQSSNVFAYTFTNHNNTNNNFLVVENHPALNLNATSWTAECWIKPTGLYAGWNTIFTKRISGTGTASYQGSLRISTGTITYYNGTIYDSGIRPVSNVWSHIAWVFNNGANLQIYLNGTNILTTSAVTSTTEQNAQFSIGAILPGSEGLYGSVSNFRMIKGQAIYTGNFSIPSYPFQLPNNSIGYHAGTTNVASTLTGNVVLLTCNDQIIKSNGNTSFNVYNFGSNRINPHVLEVNELQNFSYYFPGNTSTQAQNGTVLVTNSTNSLNLNTDFTIDFWYYPLSNTGIILERGLGGERNNTASYIIAWDSPNNSIQFAAAAANNSGSYSIGGLTGSAGRIGVANMNTWCHIAVTRRGVNNASDIQANFEGYFDGVRSFNSNIGVRPYDATARGLTIGGQFRNGQTYATGIPSNTISGYISNLRIIRGNAIYDSRGFSVPTGNLIFNPSNTALNLNNRDTVLLTAMTPSFADLSGTHVVNPNGMSQIIFSTFSPFTANAIANANTTDIQITNLSLGQDLIRIYSKPNAEQFSLSIPVPFYTLGQDAGRIYSKPNAEQFSLPVTFYNTLGQKTGKVYAKTVGPSEYGYIPIGGVSGTGGPLEYQFWS